MDLEQICSKGEEYKKIIYSVLDEQLEVLKWVLNKSTY